MREFKKFPKIKQSRTLSYVITEKLHGTNASVHIYTKDMGEEILDDEKDFLVPQAPFFNEYIIVRPAKRSGFLTLADDNFGFAKFIAERKDQLSEELGLGTFFGEFVGPGINGGCGLDHKRFALFDVLKFSPGELDLPEDVDFVPILFKGRQLETMATNVALSLASLKTGGSKYSKGFETPEGIVISLLGANNETFRIKHTFEPEEVAWQGVKKERKPQEPMPDVDHLLQPMRLEKLLSGDESLLLGVPENLGDIAKLYVADLIEENQVTEDEKLLLKAVKKKVFSFIVSILKEKGYM